MSDQPVEISVSSSSSDNEEKVPEKKEVQSDAGKKPEKSLLPENAKTEKDTHSGDGAKRAAKAEKKKEEEPKPDEAGKEAPKPKDGGAQKSGCCILI